MWTATNQDRNRSEQQGAAVPHFFYGLTVRWGAWKRLMVPKVRTASDLLKALLTCNLFPVRLAQAGIGRFDSPVDQKHEVIGYTTAAPYALHCVSSCSPPSRGLIYFSTRTVAREL